MAGRIIKKIVTLLLIPCMGLFIFSACTKESNLTVAKPDNSYFESFDSLPKVLKKGWVIVNNSRPIGTQTWFGGFFTTGPYGFEGFPAHSYFASAQEYVAVNYNSGSGVSNLSDWFISPALNMKDGDSVYFWTRTSGPVNFPDRLQVWANYSNGGADVGKEENSVGDFSQLLIDINPTLSASGYPLSWTRYGMLITNGSSTPRIGRVAFRYFVESGGPGGQNSNLIGVDDFYFVSKQ